MFLFNWHTFLAQSTVNSRPADTLLLQTPCHCGQVPTPFPLLSKMHKELTEINSCYFSFSLSQRGRHFYALQHSISFVFSFSVLDTWETRPKPDSHIIKQHENNKRNHFLKWVQTGEFPACSSQIFFQFIRRHLKIYVRLVTYYFICLETKQLFFSRTLLLRTLNLLSEGVQNNGSWLFKVLPLLSPSISLKNISIQFSTGMSYTCN